MALTPGQQQARDTLLKRKQAGTISPADLERLKALNQAAKSDAPAVAGKIMNQQQAAPPAGGPGGDTSAAPYTKKEVAQGSRDLAGTAFDMAMGGMSSYEQFDPTLSERWSSGDLAADRLRVEEEIFGRLTRDLDANQARDIEATKQDLFNRGIPYSADPNSQYQQMMGDVTKRYDTLKTDARQRATEMGGAEYERNVGLNETMRANDYSQQQGVHSTNVSDTMGFGGLGANMYGTQAQIQAAKQAQKMEKYKADLAANTALGVAGMNNRPSGGGSPAPNPEDDVFIAGGL